VLNKLFVISFSVGEASFLIDPEVPIREKVRKQFSHNNIKVMSSIPTFFWANNFHFILKFLKKLKSFGLITIKIVILDLSSSLFWL